MKTLLEYFLKYFDLFYLDPKYHITNSTTRGLEEIDASLQLTGPTLSWSLVNDRGQMELSVAPTNLVTSENWFWVSLVRQYINGDDEIEYLPVVAEIEWVRENIGPVEQIFSDRTAATCEELRTLRRANADSYWARWRKQQGLT